MTDFLRFPRTPHLAWLGPGQPRDDKVLSAAEADALVAGEVVVEEKIDGANLGFSTTEGDELRVQHRGGYIDGERAHPQFRSLWPWLAMRQAALAEALWPNRLLFGEWCYAVHSMVYDRLPDWFLGFDVYDRSVGGFWSTERRDALLRHLGLHVVPCLATGRFSIDELRRFLAEPSRVGEGPVEGIVVRQEAGGLTTYRAKLVRAEFAQAIDEHWSRKPLQVNELVAGAMAWP